MDERAEMDERYGRATAETECVDARGTVSIALVRDGDLSPTEAGEVADEMIDVGWFCSIDRYTRIVRRLDSSE